MKTKILCIVGPSGSGKTFMANHLEEEYGIPMIESRTTRPPRYEGERGHTFVTDEEFDTYEKDWMIAYTEFGGYRYACLHKDIVAPVSCYVIDEFGLKYLREEFSDLYDIFAVRLHMEDELRKELIGEERMMRDEGKFTMSDEEFDYYINTSSFKDNEHLTCKMLIRMYQKFDD